jgi:hypothetical protein
MGERKIPETYEYECDACERTETMGRRARPKYWTELTLSRDAYDYQGCAVADGTVKRLLCAECSEKVSAAINASLTKEPRP